MVVKATSTKTWTAGGWKQGVKDVNAETQERGFDDAQPGNAAIVDASRAGGRALARGEETVSGLFIQRDPGNPADWAGLQLLVNASIMNVQYRPMHAPWLVDLDLPSAASG